MNKINITHENSDLSGFSRESVAKVGKIAVEAMMKNGSYDKVLEKLNISKETLNMSTDVYTTAISGFIEQRLKPKLTAAGVIKVLSNFNAKGNNAIKVPLRNALITASDLPDSGQLTHDTGSYESTTITLSYKYASNQLTHELLKFANADLIAEEIGEIGFALANKVDSDIIAALKVATTSAGTYSNYKRLITSTGSLVSYDELVDALAAHVALYAEPDVLLLNPSSTATILKLDEFAGGTSITGALVFKGGDENAFPIPRTILGLRLVENLNCDGDDIYLIDSKRCGYLVQAGDVETFDGRVSGYLAFEVIGAINYGVGIVQPKAVYRLEEKASSA